MIRRAFKHMMLGTAAICAAPPAFSQDVIPPKVVLTTPGGVNVSTGQLMHSVTDIAIGTLKLERFLSIGPALPPNDPFFGSDMTHNFDIYVAPKQIPAGGPPFYPPHRYHTVVHVGASASGTYQQAYPLGSSSYVNEHNDDARSTTLQWVSGAYVYTDHEGAVYTFTPSVRAGGTGSTAANTQRVANIVFPDGRVQTFSYDGNGRLKMVHDSAGYALIFDYNANKDVVAACGFDLARDYVTASSTCSGATLKTTYGYSGVLLTSATDVMGETTTYSTPGSNSLTPYPVCVTPPGYSTCKVSWGASGSVYGAAQAMADGTTWYVAPSAPPFIDPDSEITGCFNEGSVRDPAGKTTQYLFAQSSPCTIYHPDGTITSYEWRGGKLKDPWLTSGPDYEGALLVSVTMPEGNKYLAEYNGPNNRVTKETLVAKPGSGLADRVKQYGYTACGHCGPTWIKDPKGNQTDFTYTSWGGLTSEMQPAPSSGAARPLKLVTYVQKSAYIKNSGGTLVSTGLPIWLPDTETLCQTYAGSSTATCDTGAPITVTSYEYGANGTADNLLLRGKVVTSGGVSLRTCYGYDAQSRKIWETSPRGTSSAVCS